MRNKEETFFKLLLDNHFTHTVVRSFNSSKICSKAWIFSFKSKFPIKMTTNIRIRVLTYLLSLAPQIEDAYKWDPTYHSETRMTIYEIRRKPE